MKKQLVIALSSTFLFSMAGCAQLSKDLDSGRYFQAFHPVTNQAMYQTPFHDERTCRGMSALIVAGHPVGAELFDTEVLRCSKRSISEQLPVRSTIRSKAYNFTLDVEADNLTTCFAVIKGILEDPDSELVVDCQRKGQS